MRGYACCARAAGTPTACRSRSRSRRSSRIHGKAAIEQYGVRAVRRALHRERVSLHRRVGAADRADRLLGEPRPTPTSPTTRATSRACGGRSRSCSTEGPALPGPQGRAGGGRRAARRCRAAEVGLGYKTVDDPSVFVAFPLRRTSPRPRSSSGPRRPGRCPRTATPRCARAPTTTGHVGELDPHGVREVAAKLVVPSACARAQAEKLGRELRSCDALKGSELVGAALPAALRHVLRASLRGGAGRAQGRRRPTRCGGASSPRTSSRSTPAPASCTSRRRSARTTIEAHRAARRYAKPDEVRAALGGESRRHASGRKRASTPGAG